MVFNDGDTSVIDRFAAERGFDRETAVRRMLVIANFVSNSLLERRRFFITNRGPIMSEIDWHLPSASDS